MKQRPGASKLTYILLVVLLGAALAAGYFLYFRPEPPETAEVTVPTVSRTAQNTKVQTKISGKVTAEKTPEPLPDPAEILAEFHTPFEATPPRDLITPVLPEKLMAKVSPPPKPAKPTGSITEEPLTEVTPQKPAAPEPEKTAVAEAETVPSPKPVEPMEKKPESVTAEISQPAPAATEPAKPESTTTEAPPTKPAPAEAVKPEPSTTGPSEPAPTVVQAPKPSTGGKWVANVLSTRDGDVARNLLDQLVKLPYHVYAYKTVVKGKEYYRIRVGFFNTQTEAEQVGQTLANQYRLPKPWIVRPGPQELKKYQD